MEFDKLEHEGIDTKKTAVGNEIETRNRGDSE
jgi:hypothetical protein